MKRTIAWILLLHIVLSTGCKDNAVDSENVIGVPAPTIGISAGLDPNLLADDEYGGLAGTSLHLPFSPVIYDNDPESLPRLQENQGCEFSLEGGVELGHNGPSTYTAHSTESGLEAQAATIFQAHKDNTRITIDFALSAIAVPVLDGINAAAEAGTSGADPFGVLSDGIIFVLDVDNFGGHDDVEVRIQWQLSGELGGDEDEAEWDGLARIRSFHECGLLPLPSQLFDVTDDMDSAAGSTTVKFGSAIQPQLIRRVNGYDEYKVNMGNGGSITGRCPSRACSRNVMQSVLDTILNVLEEIADGTNATVGFVALQLLAGLQETGYVEREGTTEYCLA